MATGLTASSTSTHIFHRQSSTMYHSNQPQYNFSPSTHHQPPPPPPSSRSSAEISPSTRPHRLADVPSTGVKSLPSIHEALGKSNPLPYPHSQPSVCGPSQTPGHIAPSSNLMTGPSAEGPSGPSNPFSSTNSSAPSLRDSILNSQHHPSAPSQSEGSIMSQDSHARSIHSIGSEKSSTRGSVADRSSICTSHAPSFDMLSTTSTAVSSPSSYVSPVGFNPSSYSSHRSGPASQTFPPPSFETRPSHSTWNFGASDHTSMDSVKSMQRSNGLPYCDAVKRHLDDYDVRASLNEVRDTSSRTLDILRPYSQRPQPRTESIDPASLMPSLAEIDELLHLHRHTAEILERIRSAAISHEHSLNEQRSHQQIFKTDYTREKERMPMYADEYKNGTTLASGNTHIMNGSSIEKKRRKAAPPGRCHSCNRAETPEWRRGPDGARTLCNACGLHYAKLTRKQGMNKSTSSTAPTSQMAMAASNIRPRAGVGRSSPLQP
ncbi:NsdD protein [Nannizzia gypsea CBS 118893]|uniref:NsdD protein n=1 Tax=Arthroderma gypseum (strain ATCC MYA-4604 / CBS 118893) TaxID=535722 RepID=E5R131_ARTGP|nr:NsdD protein [Nannizzia gypsea CBS 118893]EFQ97635.1 NsdD protein [Nannizzia gypsea CBS 118893]